MNIALTTLLVLVILLPGLVFRRFYYTEEFSKQYFKSSFLDIVISTLLPALFLHLLWSFCAPFFGSSVSVIIVGQLLTSNEYPETAFQNIQDNIGNIGFYYSTIIAAAVLLGSLSKYIIRKLQIDTRFKIFRFRNYWHYLLKGEFFDFPRASFDLERDSVKEIELIYVDALVEIQAGTILYEGVLVDYELAQDGGLEQIQLKSSQRRFIRDGNDNLDILLERNNYEIPGHILVLPYQHIVNMNLSYYKLSKDTEGYQAVLAQ
jgi:hypothetical protein